MLILFLWCLQSITQHKYELFDHWHWLGRFLSFCLYVYTHAPVLLLQPQMSHMEHMPISEWLVGYKLADYAPVLEGHGYETTELLVGISHEELQEMGINKIGHRKKLLSALSNWPQQESFFHVKPVGYCLYVFIIIHLCVCIYVVQESVSVWLSVLHLSQYEQTLLDAGYDDIDFVCDVTLDDLHDIGISKRGECY